MWVDPWSKDPALPEEGHADLVLITDIHFDHLDPEAFAKVAREGTTVVAPQAVADEKKVDVQQIVANGKSVEVGGIPIEAVPMYSIERGPEPGKLNLPYTMPPEEAAACVAAFAPKGHHPRPLRGQRPVRVREAARRQG